ncbi:MAG: hypothetical protein R2861_08555 [Desulfobacterales bacterium]
MGLQTSGVGPDIFLGGRMMIENMDFQAGIADNVRKLSDTVGLFGVDNNQSTDGGFINFSGVHHVKKVGHGADKKIF